MPTEVRATRSQVEAAKAIVERDSATGRPTPDAIRKIADAEIVAVTERSSNENRATAPEPVVAKRGQDTQADKAEQARVALAAAEEEQLVNARVQAEEAGREAKSLQAQAAMAEQEAKSAWAQAERAEQARTVLAEAEEVLEQALAQADKAEQARTLLAAAEEVLEQARAQAVEAEQEATAAQERAAKAKQEATAARKRAVEAEREAKVQLADDMASKIPDSQKDNAT